MAKFLIVDDSIIIRKNLRAILTKAGHEITGEAVDGKQGYQEFQKCKPDIITMDITMPIMNGIETVKKIIDKQKDAKIIMISAINQKNMVFEALENGAKHYIIKPITAEKVLNVVNEVLEEDEESENVSESQGKNGGKEETKPKVGNPITVENVNGEFKVKVNHDVDKDVIESLNTMVQGILFIQPLKVNIDIQNVKLDETKFLDDILAISEKIKSSDGKIVVKTKTKTYN